MIAAPVKCFHLLRGFGMDACHKSNHFAPGHFSIYTLLDNLASLRLTENTGNKPVLRLQIFFQTPGIFLRSQINDDPALVPHFPIKTVTPEVIQILILVK